MIRGSIQGIKTVILILDFRSIRHRETDLAKTPHDIVRHLRERVELSNHWPAAWQAEVGRLFWQCRFQFQLRPPMPKRFFYLRLRFVDQFANRGTFLLREGAKLLQ